MTVNETKVLFSVVCDVLISIEQYEMGNCVAIEIGLKHLLKYKDILPDEVLSRCYDYIDDNSCEVFRCSLKEILTAYARVLNNLI